MLHSIPFLSLAFTTRLKISFIYHFIWICIFHIILLLLFPSLVCASFWDKKNNVRKWGNIFDELRWKLWLWSWICWLDLYVICGMTDQKSCLELSCEELLRTQNEFNWNLNFKKIHFCLSFFKSVEKKVKIRISRSTGTGWFWVPVPLLG